MTTQLAPTPIFKAFDNAGLPLSFGFLYTYQAGTNTPQPTYTDSTGNTPNPNPVLLNARGEAQIWLNPLQNYKFLLTDSLGNQIPGWPVDNISGSLYPGQSIIPNTDNAFDIGSLSDRWRNGYFGTQIFVGPNNSPIVDSSGNVGYWARTAAEIAAGVTPVNFAYTPGDLRRYGCDITGGTDNSAQISNAINAAVASGGVGYIYHPGGTIAHGSQITIPNGLAVIGWNRAYCIFKFTGTPAGSPASTRSAWRYTGVPPWSGYANVSFRHVQIWYQNTVNFAAAIELNGWGWAYWEIDDCWIKGGCSFGIILDGVELCSVHNCLIENLNATVAYQIWIVNGPDRGFNQGQGFSNVITLRENQISGGSNAYGIADDGGNAHTIVANNFNANSIALLASGTSGLVVTGNSFESHAATGSGTVIFNDQAANSGAFVGPNYGFKIEGCGFYTDMAATHNCLSFAGQLNTITGISVAANAVVTISTGGASNPFVVGQNICISQVLGMTQINGLAGYVTAIGGASGAWTVTTTINSSTFSAYASGGQARGMHMAGTVRANTFGWVLGRGSAIDVSFLANSTCADNIDISQSGGASHYTGAHNDAFGNTLLAPAAAIAFGNGNGISGPTYTDTRYRSIFLAGVQLGYTTVAYAAAITFDLGAANGFDITATNGVAFTINSPANASAGNTFQVTIHNTSGGALGALTWGPSFKLAGAWTQPANGFSRSILFMVDSAGFSREISRSAADVPN